MLATLSVDHLSALLTLTAMEIVLGIDNIVFIAILVQRLPASKQARIRNLGIFLALGIRVLLLFSISWIMSLQRDLFSIFGEGISGRDLILICGGLFLIAKATLEIHHKIESADEETPPLVPNQQASRKVLSVLGQILLLDVVFSLDSVITAVGMAQQISIMIIAMVISMAVMLVSAGKVSDFILKHPTMKLLALSFLILIGVTLFYEGLGGHMPKGYVYFAMFFSLAVEVLNMAYRSRTRK
jgi:predicted tellurium resistance membrane protein TerC